MDKSSRNLIQKATQDARRLLEAEFSQQLEGLFDILPDGTIAPEPGKHLNATQRIIRQKIVAAIEHERASGSSDSEAVAAYLRETSFTYLNRFVALKMLEARGLAQECVSKGERSSGFKEFCGLAPGLAKLADRGYRLYIESLFDELSIEIKVLFDRQNLASLLWPRRKVLRELLSILNREEIGDIWGEDETIGWVYQYFNSGEERKKMRDKSAAPRNSRELAVRNQFFTPRYVVEFLTDNTIGRIWYEMRRGDTVLKDECRYLVRRPNEVFLGQGEKAPAESENETGLSQKDLPIKSVYIEHRPKKDPRDLRVLDPACGSGHFLLYAFDLLERVYEEAWEDSEPPRSEITGHTLIDDFESINDLRRAVPKLIMENNLHGIDIDSRAVQIAALALWLRAQRTWKNHDIKAFERPSIVRSNIVTAESMPGEEDMRREFTAGLKPRVIGQLVNVIFEKMKFTGEAGSLLKVDEEIKDAIAVAKKQWIDGPKYEQQVLFPGITDPRPKPQQLRFDFKGVTDESFWEHAEELLLGALKDYAERVENGHAIRRRLFAEDAARGLAFIDLCHKSYDVVLMNPPFGKSPRKTDQYLRKAYPRGYIDLYTAFLDRACQLAPQGYTGAITSRTALTLSSFSSWRKDRLLGDTTVRVCADLGYGVLDSAMVETACFTLSRFRPGRAMTFIDLDKVDQKEDELMMAVREDTPRVFHVSPNDLLAIPNAAMAYFLDPSLRRDFLDLPAISDIAEVLGGNATSDDMRFIRCFWEVHAKTMISGETCRWRWISKGGEYSFFYTSIHLLVDWRDDGGYLGEHLYISRPRNGYLWGPKSWSSVHMGLSGVVWSLRSQVGASFRALPSDCAMSGKSAIVTTRNHDRDLALLAILNTDRMAELSRCLSTFGSYEKGAIASLPIELKETEGFAHASKKAFQTARSAHTYCEVDPHFSATIIGEQHSLDQVLQDKKSEISNQSEILSDILSWVNNTYRSDSSSAQECRVRKIYNLSESITVSDVISELVGIVFGRWDIRIACDASLVPKLPDPFDALPVCPPGMLVGPDGLPAESGRIVSLEWLRARPNANTLSENGVVKNRIITDLEYPLCINWTGIMVDDPGFEDGQLHDQDIVLRTREVIEILWKDKVHDIEQETCEILNIPDLRNYFRKSFFKDHIKRYSKSRRKAPIYWQLSTPSASYSIWIYYHRFTKDTIYKVLNEYVIPKLKFEDRELTNVRQQYGTSPTAKQRREIAAREAFVAELTTFKEEVTRIAPLWNPNLNDGVIINFAPLWRMVPQNKPWQKECKKVWDKLVKGDYDWAHLAMHLWPERVVKKCAKDRSLAIAHGLEEGFWEEDDKGKWKPKRVSKETIDALIQERTSPTVKSALEDLLKAPIPANMAGKKRKKKA